MRKTIVNKYTELQKHFEGHLRYAIDEILAEENKKHI